MSRIAELASALTGQDGADLSVEAVHAFLSQLTATAVVTGRENVPLAEALGRVLAEDIVSPISVPPHDNSAIDGYAFDGAVLPDKAPEQQDKDKKKDQPANATPPAPKAPADGAASQH